MLFKILYADDTCVLISGNHLNNLIDILNTELMSLNNWLKAVNIGLPEDKKCWCDNRSQIKLDRSYLVCKSKISNGIGIMYMYKT